ncbi:adenosylcobinamide-phosphate synthase [Rhizobium sp. PP-F2F-G48]|uniref:adenosylcobinamide-phosphate synthase CbiB n=1 Tax=Rhizobium sp. PP-F2F-G48 TaxID=2135651 RepID=UPI00104C02A8|nr:adenosylcobinamide-phosphate synthase CbiB [Rhizobium sp. PP-F2F-G48]TCM58758.1 adenosylcobinamide-phosphate synthase [Rhizobium sp. PP-F2F-G48]
MRLVILAAGLLIDRIVGDPDGLWRRLPHPVVLFGTAIGFCERRLNRPDLTPSQGRFRGVVAISGLLLLSAVIGVVIHVAVSRLGLPGAALEALIVAVFLAQKSLSDHVLRVAAGLRDGGLAGGRQAVSMIVGRDPQSLDEAGVCRAAIESLAENFSDGVVAPLVWYAICGLPGLLAYKMLNTADSMIGHKTERYLHFGWASARLDDVANLPAARLSMLLIAGGAWWRLGGGAGQNALSVALRDQGLHRSPNSGWPEAAMAGALNLRLAGPRLYAGARVEEPMMNAAGRPVATAGDIVRGVGVFHSACTQALGLVLFAALCRLFL